VDEYQRVGMNLVAALEEVAEYASGRTTETAEQMSDEQIARSNERSLADLENLMRGVK
jgi:hypothetical protein